MPDIRLHIIGDKPFALGDMHIIPIRAMHHTMPVLGFRINDLSYLTDANAIERTELDKMKGSRVIVINALRKERHLSHFNLGQAIEILDSLAPQKAYITHISHQMGLRKELEGELPKNISLAYDGLRITC